MPSILFLSDPAVMRSNDNHETLPAAFRNAGWLVHSALPELSWISGAVQSGPYDLQSFDLVWPLGLGRRSDFIDRMQLLAHSGIRLINPPLAYLLMHGKLMWSDLMPETCASADAEVLTAELHRHERWILKPAAGSFGRDVIRLTSKDESLLRQHMQQLPGTWFMLQREIAEILQGEHRTLIVGGEVLGSYRREPGTRGINNLAAGGVARAAVPSGSELTLVDEVRDRLNSTGVGFAAIDTSGEHLIEVNIANPGGLGTLNHVWQRDFGSALVDAVQRWISTRW